MVKLRSILLFIISRYPMGNDFIIQRFFPSRDIEGAVTWVSPIQNIMMIVIIGLIKFCKAGIFIAVKTVFSPKTTVAKVKNVIITTVAPVFIK